MASLLNSRFGIAARALLIALWAVTISFAPAHAATDALNDPCQQAGVAADEAAATPSAPSDLDQKFHALHDCGTCHAHVLPAPVAVTSKPILQSAGRVFLGMEPTRSHSAAGPYRPPRA